MKREIAPALHVGAARICGSFLRGWAGRSARVQEEAAP